jgi:hypothetical protein
MIGGVEESNPHLNNAYIWSKKFHKTDFR